MNFTVFQGKINNSDFTLSENVFLKTITFIKVYLEKKNLKREKLECGLMRIKRLVLIINKESEVE